MGYNVLYISNEATLGGAAQSLLNMIKALKGRGIDAIVVIPSHGIIEEKLQALDIKYHIIPFSNGFSKIGTCSVENENKNFSDNYYAALQLQDIIQKQDIDIVHINSSVSNVGAFAALMAGVPYVWHLREFPEEDFGCEFWDKKLKIQLFRHADSIITISNIVAELYKQKYDIDSTCIYNGLDIEDYKNDLSMMAYSVKKHNFIITGAITENKGQFDAVKAVKALVDEGIKNIHLDLIGHGPEKSRWFLKQYVKKNNLEEYVTILSFQKNLTDYRKKCQYALTTSKMEALGRCTIEAMLAGNIVIGADTGGTREIIGEDESRGYLYKQGDYRSLATIMKRVMEADSEKKALCRKNAQDYAEKTFSLGIYTDKICGLYKKILEKDFIQDKTDKRSFLGELEDRYNSIIEKTGYEIALESRYSSILRRWSELTDKGIRISDILKKHNCNKVAIYGMGNLGCKLYEEIDTSGIEVSFVIDQNPKYIEEVVEVKKIDEEPDCVDIIIVAVSNEEQKIVRHYKERFGCNIIGLSELMNEFL